MDASARLLVGHALVVGAGVATLAGTASGTRASSVPSGWTIRDLGALGGTGGSVATAINDRGEVVGYSDWTPGPGRGPFTCPRRHAFLWRNGRMHDLDTVGVRSEALALNERGQIVGWISGATRTARRAVIWENGTMRSVFEPRTTRPIGGIVATGINEQGEISGYWWFPRGKARADEACRGPGAGRAFLWRRGVLRCPARTIPGGRPWDQRPRPRRRWRRRSAVVVGRRQPRGPGEDARSLLRGQSGRRRRRRGGRSRVRQDSVRRPRGSCGPVGEGEDPQPRDARRHGTARPAPSTTAARSWESAP